MDPQTALLEERLDVLLALITETLETTQASSENEAPPTTHSSRLPPPLSALSTQGGPMR